MPFTPEQREKQRQRRAELRTTPEGRLKMADQQ